MTQQALKNKVLKAIPGGSIGRYDLLPVFSDAALLSQLAQYFSAIYSGQVDYVAAPEAIGWILGVAVARALNVGFIPLRKEGKLPYPKKELTVVKYLDYSKGEKSLALKKGSLAVGSKVLIVDEWVETGASMRCSMELLEKEGCVISGLATIGIDYNPATRAWIDSGFVSFIGQDM